MCLWCDTMFTAFSISVSSPGPEIKTDIEYTCFDRRDVRPSVRVRVQCNLVEGCIYFPSDT